MKCELCQKKDATVFVKQVVNGQVKKLHACRECACEQGFDMKLAIPMLKDLILGAATSAAPPQDKFCPVCRLSASEFRKTSLLGCPACYDVFEAEVEPYLDSMPENAGHCGKMPERERAAVRVAELRATLKAAVSAQDFEKAARLRDAIAALTNAACAGVAAVNKARKESAAGGGGA
jgi:protein arginine kinase activator